MAQFDFPADCGMAWVGSRPRYNCRALVVRDGVE